MPVIRATTVIDTATGLPADRITNTLHFSGAVLDSDTADDIAEQIEIFYNGAFTLTGTAADWVNWATATLYLYDLSTPEPRVPTIRVLTLTPTSPAASYAPAEVACVSSIAAAPTAGVRVQSLRNRIYLGGLGPGAMATSTPTTYPTLNGNFCDAVRDAAVVLEAWIGPSARWVGYSPALVGDVGFPDGSWTIFRGWVDLEPDTQRRRGRDRLGRYGWTA